MNHSADPVSTRLAQAIAMSQEAGKLTLEYFQTNEFIVERKADDSPVTVADRRAEQLLRERIGHWFPGDAIIGEEFGEQSGNSGFTWILDPIDGTKSFIAGVPLYSQLIGILQGDDCVAGVIAVPALDECVFAARGQGAWWRRHSSPPRVARVSQQPTLANGVFVTSQIDTFAQRGGAEAYARLERKAYVTRTWGDGYGYLLVATGRAEVMVDPIMNVWDAAAIQPIIEEAGGSFTDWNGKPTIRNGEAIATNRLVHAEVQEITRAYPRLSQ
jgi:histidinol phosphatase-like enzyme (inositol monophosphatase family)